MSSKDRDTTVVHTGRSSGAGWFIAGAIVVAAIVAGFMIWGGDMGGSDANVTIEAPKVETPATGGNAPASGGDN